MASTSQTDIEREYFARVTDKAPEIIAMLIESLREMIGSNQSEKIRGVVVGGFVRNVAVYYGKSLFKAKCIEYLLGLPDIDVMVSTDTFNDITKRCGHLFKISPNSPKREKGFYRDVYTGMIKVFDGFSFDIDFIVSDMEFPVNFSDLDELTCAICPGLNPFKFCLGFPEFFPKCSDENWPKTSAKLVELHARAHFKTLNVTLSYAMKLYYASLAVVNDPKNDDAWSELVIFLSRFKKYEKWTVLIGGVEWKRIYPEEALREYSEKQEKTNEGLQNIRNNEKRMIDALCKRLRLYICFAVMPEFSLEPDTQELDTSELDPDALSIVD